MSAIIAKIAKVRRVFSCELKIPVTNIAKIAKITNLTKFLSQKEKKLGHESSANTPPFIA